MHCAGPIRSTHGGFSEGYRIDTHMRRCDLAGTLSEPVPGGNPHRPELIH